jgi:hypothetical protein
MSSTYSPDLRIELIGPGEQAGTWNTTTNTNLGTLIEDAIAGYISVSITSANQALTASNGVADQSRNATVALTTTTSADFAVYTPPASKQYVIFNTTAYVATVYNSTVLGNTTAAGLGVAVPAGKKVAMFSDGTNFRTVDAASFSGVLPVVNGGTGVTTSTGTGSVVLSASPALTGNPTAPTPTAGDNDTSISTTAFVTDAVATGKVNTALTGTPTAPTAAVNTNTTQLATTAFVVAQIADDAPTKTGTGASGTWGISISGNAATATSATSATSATNAGTVTTITAAQVGGAGAGLSAGDVGTYAILGCAIGGVGFGSTASGSSLYPAGFWKGSSDGTNGSPSTNNGNAYQASAAPAVSGTWRCMGYIRSSNWDQTLWMRIS